MLSEKMFKTIIIAIFKVKLSIDYKFKLVRINRCIHRTLIAKQNKKKKHIKLFPIEDSNHIE